MERLKVPPNISIARKSARALHDYIYENHAGGGKLPPEIEIARLLGVNRGTARQALNILEQMGLVYRKRGSGTYVNLHVLSLQNQAGMQIRLDTHFELGQLIRNSGQTLRVDLVDAAADTASPEIEKRLELDADAAVVCIKKLFWIEDQPAIQLEEILPLNLFNTPIREIDFHLNIFKILEDHCGCQLIYGLSEIAPCVCGEALAGLFRLDPADPVFRLTSTHFQEHNQPVLYAEGFYNTQIIQMNVLRRRDL